MLYDKERWEPKTEPVDEVSALMLKAADYLENHRWGQGALVKGNGAVCLVGALIKIEKGKVYSEDAWKNNCRVPITDQAVQKLVAHLDGESIVNWNDKPKRKKEEVIQLLRNASAIK